MRLCISALPPPVQALANFVFAVHQRAVSDDKLVFSVDTVLRAIDLKDPNLFKGIKYHDEHDKTGHHVMTRKTTDLKQSWFHTLKTAGASFLQVRSCKTSSFRPHVRSPARSFPCAGCVR